MFPCTFSQKKKKNVYINKGDKTSLDLNKQLDENSYNNAELNDASDNIKNKKFVLLLKTSSQ